MSLGWRRGFDLGGISGLDHRGFDRRCEWDLLLGLGSRRVLRRDSECGALLTGRGHGVLLPDHAIPFRVQSLPPALARSDSMEYRGADRRSSGAADLPAFRRAAGGAPPLFD